MPAMGSVNARLLPSPKNRIVGMYVPAINKSVVADIMGVARETVWPMKAQIPAIGAMNRMDIPSTVPIRASHEHRNCVNALRATMFQTSESRRYRRMLTLDG